ncbi:unnamed protein product [Ostreobium quekettii]|uniref:Uncharacterized protein n=1 Tax=Ostreobium quekettii TaxID=121088 RepID=A0A8S1J4M2_9CHLO|nr:unnamed protein product [Ostreobium quekettii]|eukprot:evm.model.scf_120.1 EVM.evm.TU.scf_120.1   scf_120:15831-20045(+)
MGDGGTGPSEPVGPKPVARAVESLGWLTESALQPRKRRAIDGVTPGTLIDLKAQLYRTQEEARLAAEAEGGKPPRRKTGKDVVIKNPGVEERDQKDRLHVKSTADRASECYAALERKADLYNRIMRGEVRDDDDIYEVDFLRKGSGHDREGPQPPGEELGEAGRVAGNSQEQQEDRKRADHGDYDSELERDERRKQQKELILEQAELTKEGRERAIRLKARRSAQMQRKRDRLKAAFIKKKMKKLKAQMHAAPERQDAKDTSDREEAADSDVEKSS